MAVANAGFNTVPAVTASRAVKLIMIDDNFQDGDVDAPQEYDLEPNDVSAGDIANPAQVDGDVAGNDVGNTQES